MKFACSFAFLACALFGLSASAQSVCPTQPVGPQVYLNNAFRACSNSPLLGFEIQATYADADGTEITEVAHLAADGSGFVPGPFDATAPATVAAGTIYSGQLVDACGAGSARLFAISDGGRSEATVITEATFRPCRPILLPGTGK